jgi:hypothetical protein
MELSMGASDNFNRGQKNVCTRVTVVKVIVFQGEVMRVRDAQLEQRGQIKIGREYDSRVPHGC